jgi:hypothetical protein
MRILVVTSVLAALILSFAPARVAADDVTIDPDRYGALAFSPKTGKYGYSWNQPSRVAAENTALTECKADDAKLLTWVRLGWAVLIIAEDNAYGFDEVHGDGASSKTAYDNALKKLRDRSEAKVKTTITICSGDVQPKVIEK